jgi:hypothetical protein
VAAFSSYCALFLDEYNIATREGALVRRSIKRMWSRNREIPGLYEILRSVALGGGEHAAGDLTTA